LGSGWVIEGRGTLLRGLLPEVNLSWGIPWRVIEPRVNLAQGKYRLKVLTPDHSIIDSVEFMVGKDILWEKTWRAVSYEQAERRERFSEKHNGKPLGWFDAGMHWQEANAHAAYLVGLCDAWDHRGTTFEPKVRDRLLRQLINGADYLALLQDKGEALTGELGPLVHQSFKIDHLVLPTDAPRAAVAWARVAACLPPEYSDRTEGYRHRAKRALDWFLAKPRHVGQPACGIPHGISGEWERPHEFTTPDLSQCVEALFLLQDGRVFSLVKQWLQRQIPKQKAHRYDGLFGHFRLFNSSTLTEKAWTHGFDPEGYGFNCGQTLGHHLIPLVALLRKYPTHPDAGVWRQALEAYAYGYFLPACSRNPFLLAPLGWFEGQGLIHFGGLWHGCNGLYGRMAAQALEFADFFCDPAFLALAEGNLQWIAGLNGGLSRDMTSACHLSSPDVPGEKVVPVSMIHGIGEQTAGSWLNLKGAICNGFATGDQFVWDQSVESRTDGPHTFTDEDWITHAGGWLSGVSRLAGINPDLAEKASSQV
jgi:hypothetical protein